MCAQFVQPQPSNFAVLALFNADLLLYTTYNVSNHFTPKK
jgi:hypothetical protein